LSVIRFTKERLLFAADAPPLAKAPLDLGPFTAVDVVRWFQAIATIDFDRLLLSDGTMLKREDVAPLAEYFTTMRAGVLRGYERGHSLRRLQDELRLEAYRTSPHYAGRAQQIAAMLRQVSMVRAELTLAGAANYLPQNPPEFCAGFETCSAGGAGPAGTAALSISIGRRIGFQAEVAASEQFWSTRARPLYDEETVLRPFTSAFLFRFNLTRSRSVSLLAGASSHRGDVRGMDRVSGSYVPIGGRHAIRDNDTRQGFIAGIDLSQRLGPFRLVVPIRVTRTRGELPGFWPSRLAASAGAGISLPIFWRLQ
jgi:hypothetical protein